LRFFRRVVPPVETIPGDSPDSKSKLEQSTFFSGAIYRLDSGRGSSRLEIACPDSGSGLILRASCFNREQSAGFPASSYSLLITAQLRVSRHDHQVQWTLLSGEKFPGNTYSQRVQLFKAQNSPITLCRNRWFPARKPRENKATLGRFRFRGYSGRSGCLK
jgi:hypothetical protein